MRRVAGCLMLTLLALLCQWTLIPTFVADPFKPNLLLIMVVYLGLRAERPVTGVWVYGMGLLQDAFSGLYFGLNAFAFLAVFMLLRHLAGRLYAQRANVLIFCVSVATVGVAFIHLLFLSLFMAAPGVYSSILVNLIPQVAVNALVASLVPMLPVIGHKVQQV